jgi:hypothetical protein
MLRTASALLLSALLAGCVATSGIAHVDGGLYSVSAENGSCCTRETPRERATRHAEDFCFRMREAMIAEDFTESSSAVGFVESYTLTFSCAATANR